MKIVNELIGRTRSSAESAHVALNASQETYAYLEHERHNTLGQLLKKAVENLEASGVDPQQAINTVAARGEYLKELSRGTKLFHQAAADIKNDESQPEVQRQNVIICTAY